MSNIKKKNIVLFVDDEKICHTLTELIIKNFTSLELVSAYSAREAIMLARRYESRLSLVITDIYLPDSDGFEIYKFFQNTPTLRELPFIFQSGYAEQHKGKINDPLLKNSIFLAKPYKQQDLLNAINSATKKLVII